MRRRGLSLPFFTKVLGPASQWTMQPLLDLQQHAQFPQLGPSPPLTSKKQEQVLLSFNPYSQQQTAMASTSLQRDHNKAGFLWTKILQLVKVHECRTLDWKHISKGCKLATKPMLWAEGFSHAVILEHQDSNKNPDLVQGFQCHRT